MTSNLFIIIGTSIFDQSDVYVQMSIDNVFNVLRYQPYPGAVKDHYGKPARFRQDEATRFSREEAEAAIAEEMKRRGDRPAKEFWVHDFRVVSLDANDELTFLDVSY